MPLEDQAKEESWNLRPSRDTENVLLFVSLCIEMHSPIHKPIISMALDLSFELGIASG